MELDKYDLLSCYISEREGRGSGGFSFFIIIYLFFFRYLRLCRVLLGTPSEAVLIHAFLLDVDIAVHLWIRSITAFIIKFQLLYVVTHIQTIPLPSFGHLNNIHLVRSSRYTVCSHSLSQ